MIKSIQEERVAERMTGCMKNEKEKGIDEKEVMYKGKEERRMHGGVKMGGGGEKDKAYTYEKERNINGVEMGRGVKRRKYKCNR